MLYKLSAGVALALLTVLLFACVPPLVPEESTPAYSPTEPLPPPSSVPVSPTKPVPSLEPSASPTPTPAPTATLIPQPPHPTLKTVGYIAHWQGHLLPYLKLERLTHLIWQSVEVTSATDPTLQVRDNYPWSQISALAAEAHAKGVKVLACLGEFWDSSKLNEIWKSPPLRAQLIANLKNLVLTYDLDGIDIDNESGHDPGLYSTFLAELYDSLNPLGKVISIAGNPYDVDIIPAAADYLDFINLMTYDMWQGVGYPYHSTYEESVQALNLWVNVGIPKNKLLMGIPFYGRSSGTGFYYYRWIVDAYDPSPSQNEVNEPLVGGLLWWNGIDLVKKKVDYVKNEGFGGVMVYELTTDAFDGRSLLLAIFEEMRR